MKRATNNNECGLPWNEGQKLTDLDFADYIAVLEKTWRDMQEGTCRNSSAEWKWKQEQLDYA